MSEDNKLYNSNINNLTSLEKISMMTLKNPYLIFISIYSSNIIILKNTEYKAFNTSIKGYFQLNHIKNLFFLPFLSSFSNMTCLLVGRNLINESIIFNYNNQSSNRLYQSLNILFLLSLPEANALSNHINQIKTKVMHTEYNEIPNNLLLKHQFFINRPSNLVLFLFFQSCFSNFIFLYSIFAFSTCVFTASVNSSIAMYAGLYKILCSSRFYNIHYESKDFHRLSLIMKRSIINYIVISGFVSKSIIGVYYFNRYFLFWVR